MKFGNGGEHLKTGGEEITQDTHACHHLSLIGPGEGPTQLIYDALARVGRLQEHAQGTKHRQTAVLDLLDLLLAVLLVGVVEVERVPDTLLAPPVLTRIGITQDDLVDADRLLAEDGECDLPQGGRGA